MNTTLWVLQALLAAIFLATGLLKLSRPIDDLAPIVGDWVHEVSPPLVRTLAALEIAAAVGLIVPAAADLLPWLAALAASGLVVVMIGAVVTHLRSGEVPKVALNVALAVLAGLVAWGRFGPYPFA